MIMCVLLCYPVSIRIYYQQGGLFLVIIIFVVVLFRNHVSKMQSPQHQKVFVTNLKF